MLLTKSYLQWCATAEKGVSGAGLRRAELCDGRGPVRQLEQARGRPLRLQPAHHPWLRGPCAHPLDPPGSPGRPLATCTCAACCAPLHAHHWTWLGANLCPHSRPTQPSSDSDAFVMGSGCEVRVVSGLAAGACILRMHVAGMQAACRTIVFIDAQHCIDTLEKTFWQVLLCTRDKVVVLCCPLGSSHVSHANAQAP